MNFGIVLFYLLIGYACGACGGYFAAKKKYNKED